MALQGQMELCRPSKDGQEELVTPCCQSWDIKYGCHHEICPACYCSKKHDQLVCDDCHSYNLDYTPYLEKYGSENKRVK